MTATEFEMPLQDFNHGMLQGLSRFKSAVGEEFSPEDFPHLRVMVQEAFSRHEGHLPSNHFIQLFVELAAISEASRKTFELEPLEDHNLQSFLGQCDDFFDSFFHK